MLLPCQRKPLLSNLVCSNSNTTPALVWGNTLHEVMQACLCENRWETSRVDDKIKQVILKGLNKRINIDVTIKQAKCEVTTRAKGLLAFPEKCISEWPKGVENADDASSPIADIYDFKLRPSLHQD
ncbi:hypothetical protein H0H87_011281 [Tephrocybe sp. NHM501043]|nr:hypothetical protein H0H87_011281 [Tephrocybe sp. NHM501043]